MEEFFASIDLPTSLGGLGIGELSKGTIEEIADVATANGTVQIGDFHPLTRADVLAIYQRANH